MVKMVNFIPCACATIQKLREVREKVPSSDHQKESLNKPDDHPDVAPASQLPSRKPSLSRVAWIGGGLLRGLGSAFESLSV